VKKIIIGMFIVGIIATALHSEPKAAEREVIDVDWDLTYYEPEEEAEEAQTEKYNREVLARVCMSEAGTEAFIGKVAVVTTILNRCDNFGQTVEQVVYAPNQYSTANNGTPTEEVYRAVDVAISQRDLFPADMMYFRKYHYHGFGKPYTVIGSHYFSTKGE